MRAALLLATGYWLLATGYSPGQPPTAYKIEKEGRAQISSQDRAGRPGLYVTLQFKVRRTADGELATDVTRDEIVVEEDGRRVADLEIQPPAALEPVTTVLAIDSSGSMADHRKMDEAKRAARVFLDRLQGRADSGLVLFDHELRVREGPVGDPRLFPEHRGKLHRLIEAATPRGGTAYLDATAEAVHMVQGFKGRRAVLVLTDGVDLNSQHTLPAVIALAQKYRVPVYTLGVGEPGGNEPVSSVLVLDRSGSMAAPADDSSRLPKIDALRRAAARFVDLMRPGAATTLMPFGNAPETPKPFSADAADLKQRVEQLRPEGETALFDAAHAAVETLLAARRPGKQAVVVLTDGVDNRSRHRAEEVIELAREARVPLHMLGLGRAGELNEEVMQRMARETGGTYHHARDEQALFQIFESLSIQLHDDGIDEASLKKLAEDTGGKYYPARDVSRLQLIYQELAEELQTTYTVTFPSRRPSHDGTARGIDIYVERGGARVSDVARAGYQVHGVVVPEMDHRVYLGLLAVLGVLLALPAAFRRPSRSGGTT